MLWVFRGQYLEGRKGFIVIQIENLIEADPGFLQETRAAQILSLEARRGTG